MGVTMSGQVYPAQNTGAISAPLLIEDLDEGHVMEIEESAGADNKGYDALYTPTITTNLFVLMLVERSSLP